MPPYTMTKNCPNWTKTIQAPSYLHCQLFIKHINQSVRLLKKFTEYPFLIIVCLYIKNGLNRINNSLSPHIPNRKIFELPVDRIPHRYISQCVSYNILMKLFRRTMNVECFRNIFKTKFGNTWNYFPGLILASWKSMKCSVSPFLLVCVIFIEVRISLHDCFGMVITQLRFQPSCN